MPNGGQIKCFGSGKVIYTHLKCSLVTPQTLKSCSLPKAEKNGSKL